MLSRGTVVTIATAVMKTRRFHHSITSIIRRVVVAAIVTIRMLVLVVAVRRNIVKMLLSWGEMLVRAFAGRTVGSRMASRLFTTDDISLATLCGTAAVSAY